MASLFGNNSKATTPHFVRRERESKTVAAMIGMYCRGHHRGSSAALCPRCARLSEYAARRLGSCVFGDDKPTCAKCTVHCYSAGRREEIRMVMQWAGPRMLLKHPLLAMYHLLAGRRPAPSLPGGKADRRDPHAAPQHAAKR
ncbi:MAG: nitrous oxide-stimulated promoter family protein [Sterolibacterium sp.]